MAVTVEVTTTKLAGTLNYAVKVSETDVAAATEYEVTGLPYNGRIVSFLSVLTGGAAATIQPVIGTASGFNLNSINHIASQSAAAAYINDATVVPYAFLADGKLYIRSTPNTGADNGVSTFILIVEGGG